MVVNGRSIMQDTSKTQSSKSFSTTPFNNEFVVLVQIQALLQEMESRLDTLSGNVLQRIDAMNDRIDHLDTTLSQLMKSSTTNLNPTSNLLLSPWGCDIMPAAIFAIALGIAQLLGIALLTAAIFAPTYHYQTVSLPGGAAAVFDISLFKAQVSSSCVSQLFYSGQFHYSESCRQFIASMNNKSLGSVFDILCGSTFSFYGLLSSGCNDFYQIYLASMFTIAFLVGSVILSFVAFILFALFFTCRPLMVVRRGILASQMGGLLFSSLACTLFVIIGGNLRAFVFTSISPSPSFQISQTDFSFGSGFAVAVCACAWCWSLPIWTIWAVKLKYCEDYWTEENEREEEASQLLAEIQREAARLDPATAQSILNPVSGRDVINWYTGQRS